jgi:hypothetical protein
MSMFRQFKKQPKDTSRWVVQQLHRIDEKMHKLGSWEPIEVVGEAEARRVAAQLQSDNRWGGPKGPWPYVTCTRAEAVS